MNIFFTICNRTELPNAIALGSTVKKYHPEAQMIIGWVDEAPVPSLPEDMLRLSVKVVAIPNWATMYERYYDFELVAACRPWFAHYILQTNLDCSRLIFLAPTTFLYQAVPFESLPDADLLLTPHMTQPLPVGTELDDKRILNIGMYHAGAWMLRRGTETEQLLIWWKLRTFDRAHFDLCQGMCMDQLWLNFAPIWVRNTSRLSLPGWHLGLHSITQRDLTVANGAFQVNGAPLISADFAGLPSYHPVWSDHERLLKHNRSFEQLYRQYVQYLEQYKTYRIKNAPAFGQTPAIKGNRTMRKGMVSNLKKVLSQIDRYEIGQGANS
ncbi:hypothetical protein [Telluribacter sp. SYSU D00476]|uniref:hypothetical protein n=1 Tax=Telluribacter sp. SYSU D00476 TaxID=2811430 RepID=UPI001FF327EF|nr:hypothetical protein [Telluribacter sp. SYSU D00476]